MKTIDIGVKKTGHTVANLVDAYVEDGWKANVLMEKARKMNETELDSIWDKSQKKRVDLTQAEFDKIEELKKGVDTPTQAMAQIRAKLEFAYKMMKEMEINTMEEFEEYLNVVETGCFAYATIEEVDNLLDERIRGNIPYL